MESNRTYFMRRAAQERSAATNSSHAQARQAHQRMADHYQQLASGDSAEDQTAA